MVIDARQLQAALDRIAELAPELRQPLRAKQVLAEVAFEGVEMAVSAETAKLVLRELESPFDPGILLSDAAIRKNALLDAASVFDLLHRRLTDTTAEQLRARLQTGLDDTDLTCPKEALDDGAEVRALINELVTDQKLAGLAKLAKELLAVTAVPRTLARQDELAIGGVADLSNRGSLDRLLVTELANDDLTLAVRVAENEALYLRREPPRQHPPHHRALLIDAGVRLWGVPRVFATAAALALAAGADAGGEVLAYRAAARSPWIHSVDLTTKTGLVAHLAALETGAHVGAALSAFCGAISANPSASIETVIITSEDALDDPGFRRDLDRQDTPAWMVATVNRDGRFRLWTITPAGRRVVREATLRLSDLLRDQQHAQAQGATPRRRPPLVATNMGHLPAIISYDPLPLLLPAPLQPSRLAVLQTGQVVGVTTDGRLLLWQHQDEGPAELTARIPPGSLEALLAMDANPVGVAIIRSRVRDVNRRYRVVVNAETMEVDVSELAGHPPKLHFAVARGGIIYLTMVAERRLRVEAYGLTGTTPLASLLVPEGHRRTHGRAFSGRYMVAYNGSEVVFEQFLSGKAARGRVIDCPRGEGPLVVTPELSVEVVGSGVRVADPAVPAPNQGSEDVKITASEDGLRLVADDRVKDCVRAMDLAEVDPAWQTMPSTEAQLFLRVGSEWRQALKRQPPLRHRFTSVGVTPNGCVGPRDRNRTTIGAFPRRLCHAMGAHSSSEPSSQLRENGAPTGSTLRPFCCDVAWRKPGVPRLTRDAALEKRGPDDSRGFHRTD